MQQSQRYVKEDNFRYVVPPSFHISPSSWRVPQASEEVVDIQREGLAAGLPAETCGSP
jgi:hypothetical protein